MCHSAIRQHRRSEDDATPLQVATAAAPAALAQARVRHHLAQNAVSRATDDNGIDAFVSRCYRQGMRKVGLGFVTAISATATGQRSGLSSRACSTQPTPFTCSYNWKEQPVTREKTSARPRPRRATPCVAAVRRTEMGSARSTQRVLCDRPDDAVTTTTKGRSRASQSISRQVPIRRLPC